MKKLIVLILVFACFIFSSCFLYFFRDTDLGGWEIVGEQYFPEEGVSGLDLLYDPGVGPLLIVLFFPDNSSNESLVMTYRYAENQWTEYSENLPEEACGWGVCTGFLSDGSLCIVPTWSPSVVSVWNSGSWESIEDVAFADLWNKTAGFSEDGDIYLVLEDAEDDYSLSVYRYNGSIWQIMGTTGQFGAAQDAWIGFNPAGDPLFFSCDYDSETGYSLQIYRWTGTVWTPLADFPEWAVTPYGCRNPIASSGTELYCLVRDESGGYPNARLLQYAGTEWLTIGDMPLIGVETYTQHLLVDSAGNPLAALEDCEAFNEMTVRHYREDTWGTLGIRGFSFGDAADTAVMVIGTDGYLYLAYRAVGHENVASVMRYPLGSD